MRRLDTAALLASVGLAAGLALMFDALADTNPVAFFGTPEEREARAAGRERVVVATAVLVAVSLVFAVRRRWFTAGLAMAAGVACCALAFGFPETLFAWPAFIALAPAALGAALLACRPKERP